MERFAIPPSYRDPDPDEPWYIPARYFARQLVKEDSTLLNKKDLLAEKVAQSLGMPPLGHASVGGASDGNFAAAAGAQVLDGLGAVGEGAHAAHESVDISTLEDRSKLLHALIKDLLND